MEKSQYYELMLKTYQKIQKKYGKNIVRDGIINYDVWKTEKVKILYLLKESYGGYLEIGDSAHNSGNTIPVNSGASCFWYNISRWNYVIRQLLIDNKTKVKMPENYELPNVEEIAILDIKKIDQNKKTSNNSEIMKYATNNKDIINEQINIVNPDIIICGNTFNALKVICENDIMEVSKNTEKLIYMNKYIIIDFHHPGVRKKYEPFEELIKIIKSNRQEIRKRLTSASTL